MLFRHLLPLALFLCVSTARGAAPIFIKGVIPINAIDIPDDVETPSASVSVSVTELPDTPLAGLHNKTLRSRIRRDIAPHAEPRPESHAEPRPESHAETRPESLYAEPRPEFPAETRPESRYADPANTTTHNEGFVGKLSSMMQRITNETEEDIITAQRLALVKQAVELVRLALSEKAPPPP